MKFKVKFIENNKQEIANIFLFLLLFEILYDFYASRIVMLLMQGSLILFHL